MLVDCCDLGSITLALAQFNFRMQFPKGSDGGMADRVSCRADGTMVALETRRVPPDISRPVSGHHFELQMQSQRKRSQAPSSVVWCDRPV